MEKEIAENKELIAYCGLYCGACHKYLAGKCVGCRLNEKAEWCIIRKCNKEHAFHTCAECEIKNVNDCRTYNTFISRLIAFFFKSDRKACIDYIRENGEDDFAKEMTEKKMMTIKKK